MMHGPINIRLLMFAVILDSHIVVYLLFMIMQMELKNELN